MVAFSLKAAGYLVVDAVDGQDGLEKAQLQTVDLVLTDQNMPRMDGLQLIKALRQLPAYQKVPILMLTTESSDEMKSQGRAAGANGWLVKPFDPERLIEVVKKVIG
jgi:two-component system chemotaxis response regulator CheY